MSRAIGAGVFVAIAFAGFGFDLVNRRPSSDAPTLSQALRWLQARPVGQLAVLAAWSFTGWHFFVR